MAESDGWIKALHVIAKMKEGQFVPPEAYRLYTGPLYCGYRKVTNVRPGMLKTDSLSRCVGENQVTMKEVFKAGSDIENLPPGSRGIWFHICTNDKQGKAKTSYEKRVRKSQALLDGKVRNPNPRIWYYSLNQVIGSYKRILDISEVEFRIYGTTSYSEGWMFTVLVCPKASPELDQKRFPVMKVGKCYDVIKIVEEESGEDIYKYHLEWTPYSMDPNWMNEHLTFLFYVPASSQGEDELLLRYQKTKSCKERELSIGKLPAQSDPPAPKCEPPSPQYSPHSPRYSPPSPQRAPPVPYFDTPPPSPSSTHYKPFEYLSGLNQHQQEENINSGMRLRSVQNDLAETEERLRLKKAINPHNHNFPAQSDDASDSHSNSPAKPKAHIFKLGCKSPKINVHDPEFYGIDKAGVRAMSRELAIKYFGKPLLAKSSLNQGDYNHLDDSEDMERIQKQVVRIFASNGNDEDIIRLCRSAISTYCSYLRGRNAAHYVDESPGKYNFHSNYPAKPKACVLKARSKTPRDPEYDNINTTNVRAMSTDLAKYYFGEEFLAKSSLNRGNYNHLDDYDDMKKIQNQVVRKFASDGDDLKIIRSCRLAISTYCSNLRRN